jgi:cytochrome P450
VVKRVREDLPVLVRDKPRLAISDLDMIKEVLMNISGSFVKPPQNPMAKLLFAQGLPGLTGEKWAIHRRITTQAFNMERVKVIIHHGQSFFLSKIS